MESIDELLMADVHCKCGECVNGYKARLTPTGFVYSVCEGPDDSLLCHEVLDDEDAPPSSDGAGIPQAALQMTHGGYTAHFSCIGYLLDKTQCVVLSYGEGQLRKNASKYDVLRNATFAFMFCTSLKNIASMDISLRCMALDNTKPRGCNDVHLSSGDISVADSRIFSEQWKLNFIKHGVASLKLIIRCNVDGRTIVEWFDFDVRVTKTVREYNRLSNNRVIYGKRIKK